MQRSRNRQRAKRASAVFAAGVIFQTAQCTPDQQNLFNGLATSIASVFVTDYVFNKFGVSQPGFGF